jgi:hypothetical protein
MNDADMAPFIVGIILGAAITLLCFVVTENNPSTVRLSIQKQAIERGYGTFALDTNTIPPAVKFEWIKKD